MTDYPTGEQLETIKNWKPDDLAGLMAYIKPLWQYADCGYWTEKGGQYHISTAGWSGNEDIIGAMRGNLVWWFVFWCQETKGGHYIFSTQENWLGLK